MSLFDSFKDVSENLAFSPLSKASIRTENIIFRLHYIHTVGLLIVFSVLLSLSQYAGDPIDCIGKQGIANDDYETLDSYCWVEGTYARAPGKGHSYEVGDAHRGIKEDNRLHCFDSEGNPKEDECWHNSYYQWVALVLVMQAACFYLPKYVWQICEEGKLQSLVSGLDRNSLIRGLTSKECPDMKAKLKDLVQLWRDSKGSNNARALKYYACEALNALNVLAQFYITQAFLRGNFGRIALDGLEVEEHDSVLPLLAECKLEMFGKSGGTDRVVALCVLPLNIVNQKFYTIFWFWLSALQILSVGILAYRLIVVCCPEARDLILKSFYNMKDYNVSYQSLSITLPTTMWLKA